MTTPHLELVRPEASADAAELERMDDAELDALPYGVICLERDGTILRYNAAEARLARLDRTTVIGRSFFDEVAPCTKTEGFHGRFERYVREGGTDVLRFEYLFDFRFGAQEVDVELVRAPGAERFYLLVNRTRFLPARPDAVAPAPRHRELVEVEERGVLRDASEQRTVHAPLDLFAGLLKTCDLVAPETWERFCREWGLQWGRRVVVELEARSLEATTHSLRERPMADVSDELAAYVAAHGWGGLRLDLGDTDAGVLRLRLAQSALADADRAASAKVRRCHLFAGMFGAVFTHLGARRLYAVEVRCRAQGAAECDFFVVGRERGKIVHRLAKEGTAPDAILEALRSAP